MLTSGKLTKTTFSSFQELGREVHRADRAKAEGLRKTRAARQANKARRSR